MRKILPYILIALIISCSNLKNGTELLKKKKIELVKVKIPNKNDSLKFNELRLHTYSAFHTQKFMFEKFGHWDKVIKINNHQEYLIWNNCKIFETKDDVYTVLAAGTESRKEMFSSVIVRNNDFDLLSEKSKLKDTLVSLFYYGTKKISFSKDKFYYEYWKMRDSIK